ncbi:ActS/PrrB/RegB family redox-sensitive histidine kinase [Kordiimonas aquimaris]|uniref:ActS/PrrB/RegB family redox-sensitive histidine kinase n=1 Tax=Kordiimonas aquimaris TaxID=707591 RepID=UPI0021D1FECB|nr:ActS/PrrB/RegB family redox-sensitive histidine kinase [Kordiimonas aquimaris]
MPYTSQKSINEIYPDFGPESGVQLHTIITIRWLGLAGQLFALALVGFGLGFDVMPEITVPLVLASGLLNVWATLQRDGNRRLSNKQASAHLAFDLIHLAALLFVTGGLANPFSVLMLVPTTVSATMLTRTTTYGLIGLSIALVTALAYTPFPLPWDGEPPVVSPLFRAALWISLCFTLIFLAIYMARVGREGRLRARALAATQFALEQEQRLAAIGALAAAAAHELGTPMGTIMLAAKELLETWDGDENARADLQLILDEVTRCRDILSELRDHKTAGDGGHFITMSVAAVLHEAAGPHENRGVDLHFDIDPSAEFEITRAPEIIHATRSIIENAAGFARTGVIISAHTADNELIVTIDDDGPGFDPQIIKRLGEPYVTTRSLTPGRDGGMGLGLFIAKSLLERVGASLTFSASDTNGARACIRWPEAADRQPSQTQLHVN